MNLLVRTEDVMFNKRYKIILRPRIRQIAIVDTLHKKDFKVCEWELEDDLNNMKSLAIELNDKINDDNLYLKIIEEL